MQDVCGETGRDTLTIARSTVIRFAVDVADARKRVRRHDGPARARRSRRPASRGIWPACNRIATNIGTASSPVGFCLASTWPLLPLLGLCLAFAWPLLGLCLAFAWPLLGLCLAFAWPLLGLCIASASPLHRLCIASASPLHRLCIASAPPLHRLCSAPHRLHIASALPLHRLHISPASPLLHRCNFVQDAAPRHTRRCGA